MKFAFPSYSSAADSPARPGFDVLMAVTGARQSATETARQVATLPLTPDHQAHADQRRRLFTHGRLAAGFAPTIVARFADCVSAPTASEADVEVVATQMNGAFTRAFQPMVKHAVLYPHDMAGPEVGTGSGME